MAYSSSSIETLRFPANLRSNPSMYLGSTDEHGLWLIARELLDNGLDEHLAGRNKGVIFVECKDGSYWVIDFGAGIPQGFKSFDVNVNGKIIKNKMPTMQAIFSELHTSGKFRSEAYKVSVGCFTGDTEIRLLNGKVVTFEHLYKRWCKKQTPIDIMTWDLKKDRVAYSKISHVQLSKYVTELAEVNVDGKIIRCTLDHPFYVRTENGIKSVPAKDLQPGDSLVSVYLRTDPDGYLYSNDLRRNNKKAPRNVHRSVQAFYNGWRSIQSKVVHHINHKRTDNRPSNLQTLTVKEHDIVHEKDRSESSRSKMLNDAIARSEKSAWFTKLNRDADVNIVRVQTKALTGGLRCLHAGLPLTKANYSLYRIYGSLCLDNLSTYFGSWSEYKRLCKSLYAYHKKRAVTHKVSEDFLNSLSAYATADDMHANNVNASYQAMFKNWRTRFKRLNIAVSALTPRKFNGVSKNVGYGAYACLRGWTTLKEFKLSLEEGRDPRLFDDVSDDARERRSALAEAKMRDADSRARVIHKFVLACRRLNAYNEVEYMRIKTATDPKWVFACACCFVSHGVKEKDVVSFIKEYNHTVTSVRIIETEQPVPVYGMTVDNYHTYFVEPGVLVRNTHGCGSKGTNATSDFFDVYTRFEGEWYSIKFEKGILTQPVEKIKVPKGPTGKPLKRGTAIHFKPDATIFNGKSNIDLKFAHQWAEITSYLNPGFTVMIIEKNGKSKKYYSEQGPVDYVDKILDDLKANAESQKFIFHNDLCDLVVAFSNAEGLNLRGYTNGLFNSQGGKHVDSVCNAIVNTLKEYAKKKQTISPYDVKEGLVGIVNMKLHKAEFSSQDKSRLTDLRAGKDFEELLTLEFASFFKKNKALAGRLCEKASKLSQLRSQFRASKKVVQALNAVKRKGMPAKYSPYDVKTKIEDRELLIVEGESASGGLREKRKPWQALCPLRGKISNSFKNGQKTLESEEVLMILGALGFDPKADDPLKKLQIEKVICLADPDPDGPLVGNTLIPTNKGLMPIWEVANAYRKGIDYTDLNRLQVLAYDEKKREPIYADLTWAGVTCRTAIKYTVSFLATNIQTASIGEEPYEIECTASHKWAVREDDGVNIRYVRTDELQLGDNVVSYILFANKKGFIDVDSAISQKVPSVGTVCAITKKDVSIYPDPDYDCDSDKAPIDFYCLEVEGTHNFFAVSPNVEEDEKGNYDCNSVANNAFLCHNCHINSLLLALFYKYLPELFNEGRIFVADVPELYAQYKDKLILGDTLSEVQEKLKKLGAPKSTPIHHIKGWGEIDASLMEVLAVNKETRRLIQIEPLTARDATDFVSCMNDDVEFRKRMLNLP